MLCECRTTSQEILTLDLVQAFGQVRYLEADAYLKLIDSLPSWLRPIGILTAVTGMRRTEISQWTRQQIDRANRLISLEETKNHERRVIPVNDTAWAVLESIPPRLDTPYLFAGPDGKPLSLPHVSVAFKPAFRKAGIANFRFHDPRHHFASQLTMCGHNQRTLIKLLGHEDPKMTVRYQHLTPEHLQGAVRSLDDLAKSAK